MLSTFVNRELIFANHRDNKHKKFANTIINENNLLKEFLYVGQ